MRVSHENRASDALCVVFSQEWIHRITDNMLISSKTTTSESPKGGDNRSAKVASGSPAPAGAALADDREDMYGIGYLNPAFDDNNAAGARPTTRPGSQIHSLLKHTFLSH